MKLIAALYFFATTVSIVESVGTSAGTSAGTSQATVAATTVSPTSSTQGGTDAGTSTATSPATSPATAPATTQAATTVVPTTGAPSTAAATPAPTSSPTWEPCDLTTISTCYTNAITDISTASDASEMCTILDDTFVPCMGGCIGSSIAAGEGDNDVLAPFCGRGDDTTLYDTMSAYSGCDSFLENICGTDKLSVVSAILASVPSVNISKYLDESDPLNIELRTDTCEAVVSAIEAAVGVDSQVMSSSSNAVSFSCTATVEVAAPSSRRLRSLSSQSSIKVTTTVVSDEEFSPQSVLEMKSLVDSDQANIAQALIDSANDLDGVSADPNQEVEFTSSQGDVTQPPAADDDDSSLSTGALIGIVAGCLAGIALVAAGVMYAVQRKSHSLSPQEGSMKLKNKSVEEPIAKGLHQGADDPDL